MIRMTIVCGMLLFGLAPMNIAAEPQRLALQPGQKLTYRIERELTATTKALGETNTTDVKIITDVVATASQPDERGRITLSLQATHVEGSAPAFEGLMQRQMEFNDATSPAGAAIPAWHFLPALAMKRHPLELVYEPSGALAGVRGLKAAAADVDAMLVKDFQRHIDFGPTRAIFPQIYTEGVQKAMWEDLLVVDLPNDLEPGVEWKERQLGYIQPFYVWMDTARVAQERDGGWEIETSYQMPKGKTASVKFDIQTFEYSVKNGEGGGTLKLDADGKVRELKTIWHVYFDLTAIALGQRTPVDELYQRVKYSIVRQD